MPVPGCAGPAGRATPPRHTYLVRGRDSRDSSTDRQAFDALAPTPAHLSERPAGRVAPPRDSSPACGRVQPGHTVDRPPPGARAPAPARAGAGTEDRGSLLQRTAHVLPGTRPFGRG